MCEEIGERKSMPTKAGLSDLDPSSFSRPGKDNSHKLFLFVHFCSFRPCRSYLYLYKFECELSQKSSNWECQLDCRKEK